MICTYIVAAGKKQFLFSNRTRYRAAGLVIEKQCYARLIGTQDRTEGLAAFREGRKPVYSGQ